MSARRALLHTASGGFVALGFGLLSAGAAEAKPTPNPCACTIPGGGVGGKLIPSGPGGALRDDGPLRKLDAETKNQPVNPPPAQKKDPAPKQQTPKQQPKPKPKQDKPAPKQEKPKPREDSGQEDKPRKQQDDNNKKNQDDNKDRDNQQKKDKQEKQEKQEKQQKKPDYRQVHKQDAIPAGYRHKADDGDDPWPQPNAGDPYPEDPIPITPACTQGDCLRTQGILRRYVQDAMDRLDQLGVKVRSQGTDSGAEVTGPDKKGGIVHAEAHYDFDHGTWSALDGGIQNGEYALTAKAEGGVEAGKDGVGAKAEAKAGLDVKLPEVSSGPGPVTVSAQPELMIGPGVTAEATLGKGEDGKYRVHVKAGFSPLVGGSLGLDMEVDPQAIEDGVLTSDVFKDFVSAVAG
ncbi:hypothetical protein [Amycolatopsis sp. WQ 127309]|uniref:hypothetical protein n=1 Tax=Amycolatopsis sp. WQ 127309 TaxID=2932773 RepID=UPI001FF14D8C|nr:hypothetical protein [Amycolatopsis sp. WQ 127309]UOZ07791.1 hypothetical protein MUY22_05735 [Amycolatopsis sp. WQ 127309]